MQPEPYVIRYTRPDDLAVLPSIEQAAAAQFRATPYTALADDADENPVSAEIDLGHEYVWVAVDQQDHPIAFAIVHLFGVLGVL